MSEEMLFDIFLLGDFCSSLLQSWNTTLGFILIINVMYRGSEGISKAASLRGCETFYLQKRGCEDDREVDFSLPNVNPSPGAS